MCKWRYVVLVDHHHEESVKIAFEKLRPMTGAERYDTSLEKLLISAFGTPFDRHRIKGCRRLHCSQKPTFASFSLTEFEQTDIVSGDPAIQKWLTFISNPLVVYVSTESQVCCCRHIISRLFSPMGCFPCAAAIFISLVMLLWVFCT